MLGRKSKTTVIEPAAIATAGSRAAEVVGDAASEFAERAVAAAQTAQRAATPVLRTAAEKSAETLSHAAERAAIVLADTAGRLADSAEERGGQASVTARNKLADASEALAQAVRPKRKRRIRRVLALGAIAAGLVALVRSPLRTKIADRLFGAPPEFDDDAPASITLPSNAPAETGSPIAGSTEATAEDTGEGGPRGDDSVEVTGTEAGGGDSNGVATSSAATGESAKS